MLRRFIPVFTTNVNRYYSISSLHYNSTVPESTQINLHQNIYKLRLEKCSQIDFDCDEPLPLDWSDLPDAQVHHSDRLKDGIKLPEAVKKRRN
ncbi:unnamed protein product [Rotaria socialis]|uniref:Uncharacterized protein n=1 Tax=Rotaria socialis TaxID=392032 RepID=A0A817SZG3_9BILA|nr:unnamed protein product [Rotaria socialis]CAF3403310.1 unnamed protein product [Rotaria socialis]CAF3579505.1 unnamed protein product [Rotaria socialis]